MNTQAYLLMNESICFDILPPMETTGGRIRHLRARVLGLTQEEFAQQLQVTRGAVGNWERDQGIKNDNIVRIADRFGVSVDWLVNGRGTPPDGSAPPKPAAPSGMLTDAPPPNIDLSQAEDLPHFRGFGGPRNVPEYGAAIGGRRGDADFQFNGQTVDWAPRPPGIMHKKDVYSLRVTGISMIPKYEEGERIYVDPHRPPAIMDYVVIELKPSEEGEPGDGFIKRLVRRTPTKIVVSQFNPPMEIEFDRDEVKSLHRVIPVDELLGI
ncbi:XRE family transcriptional regulator [Microvirga arsenatis]|uniref:Helix-turn-helix domain-containing protein n=1 Tax=Microvirga arsenatis TaxID=2692265 RepID=A0ABW9YZN6_9HYPH|nr:XRE family transcriptional regulator [Microvirga arsenatis]NBJ13226.1 helix-turn-helix domain-containing protein [Microvirga arsenatis]NBJ25136.1 helix-turn-helix domain-containing protein [Microvirga arsenatis]